MADSPIEAALTQALGSLDPALELRAETDADYPFIAALFAETRRDELTHVPWPEQAKRDFLASQCRLQHDHYAKHYAHAELLLIECSGRPIGRIYVHASTGEIRLMEIALLGSYRNRGIGTALVRGLQDLAASRQICVTLHVEPTNPAQNLYRRLGFGFVENRGIYDFLDWTPSARPSAES